MTEIKLREPDDDLIPLLQGCTADELDNLVGYITQKGGTACQLKHVAAYKEHFPDHTRYADEIAAEIQKFGGNTILNIIRGGKGLAYKDIVCNVASRVKAEVNPDDPIEQIEQKILMKVLELSWEKMDKDQKTTFFKGIIDETDPDSLPKEFPGSLINTALIAGGVFASYRLSAIVASAVAQTTLKRGISMLAGAAVARWAAVFTGAVGLGLTTIWTLFDAAGPSYRVIIPCVMHIAMLRQLQKLKDETRASTVNNTSDIEDEQLTP